MKHLAIKRTLAVMLLLLPLTLFSGCNNDDNQFPGGGQVQSVQIGVDNANFTGACPHTFRFNGVITTTGSGTITYFWERSNGQNTSPQNVALPVPGAVVVTNDLVLNTTGSVSVKLKVTRPNAIDSNAINVTLTCQ